MTSNFSNFHIILKSKVNNVKGSMTAILSLVSKHFPFLTIKREAS